MKIVEEVALLKTLQASALQQEQVRYQQSSAARVSVGIG